MHETRRSRSFRNPTCGHTRFQLLRRLTGASLLAIACLTRASEPASPPPASELPVPAPEEQDYSVPYRPYRTDRAAISPDGQLIAYTIHENAALSVMIVEVDHPETVKLAATVMDDKDATAGLDIRTRENTPARAYWMGWTSPTRLIIETNSMLQIPLLADGASATDATSIWNAYPGVIYSVDVESRKAEVLVTPKKVATTLTDPAAILNRRASTAMWSPALSTTSAFNDTEESAEDESGPPAQTDGSFQSWQLPRIPSVLGFDPDDHQSLIVLAEGIDWSETFRLNTASGSLRSIDEEPVDLPVAALFDPSGRMRVRVPVTTNVRFPHAFSAIGIERHARWRDLSATITAPLAAGFAISPANYFGERAVPLGFSRDGATLYFASNIGRNTFGIYGFNTETGQQTSLAIEHPDLDLYEPVAGVFPDPACSLPPIYQVRGAFDSEWLTSEIEDSTASETANTQNALSAAMRAFSYALRISRDQRPDAAPGPLIYDPFSGELAGVRLRGKRTSAVWLSPEIQAVQSTLERTFPDKSVEIRDWDQARNRFIVLIHGPADPGAFHLFDRTKVRAVEFVSRAPWLDPEQACPTMPFGFKISEEAAVTGLLSLPRHARTPNAKKVPLIVMCSSSPWLRCTPEFDPDVESIVRMGFAVLRVDARGTWGMGIRHRAPSPDGFVPAQSNDILAAIDLLAAKLPINVNRVGLIGTGLGGHLALRTLQAHPDRFRCAVAIEAPLSLRAWKEELRWDRFADGLLLDAFFGSGEQAREEPLIDQPETIKRPVCVFGFRGDQETPSRHSYREGRTLVSQLRRSGLDAQFVDFDADFLRRLPSARARVWKETESFLYATIYDYKAEAGETYILGEP